MAQRPPVTVLFADISGFTALADRLDADALHEILSPVIGGLAQVAERHGGFIAKYAGDALMVFFGHPVARPDDPDRACRAALEMHEELARIAQELPEGARGLELHVGIDTGELAEGALAEGGGRSLLGGPVTYAQRLESLAGPGETYVGRATFAAAGERFELEALGALAPKAGGRVDAWRLLRANPSAETQGAAVADPDAVTEEAVRAFVSQQVAALGGEGRGEERRLVTALFADFVGVTDLALEADRANAVLADLVDRLTAVAARYEGWVARYAGDAILVFFGAPVAHEDDPERALRLAIEMHGELERAIPELPPEAQRLGLHIGVNSGHVISGMFGGEVRTDYSILGDAVNLAQRLESASPAGETYVGATTEALTRARFDLESVGDLSLKGKATPVPAWRVVGERSASAFFGDAHRGSPLVGRDEELAVVTELLEGLPRHGGGILAVSGEPGVGKSRLTSEVRGRATERGVRWLSARSISYGASLAYWPVADLLRRELGVRIEDDPGEAATRLRSSLEDLAIPEAFPFFASVLGLPAGDAGEEIAGLEPEAFRRGVHRAFSAWIGVLTEVAPVVLAVEDLHWTDTSTIELIKELAREGRGRPLLLYLTGRPEAAELLGELASLSERAHAVELRPLETEAITSLVGWLLGGGAPPRDFIGAVIGRTGGNPFFVEELVRSLLDAGTLEQVDGRWRTRGAWSAEAVPATVEGVLAARIDLLAGSEAEILHTASVIGRLVRLDLLRAITEEGPELETSLRRLVEAGFLDPMPTDGEESLMFHHALVQEVAYSRLVRRRRQRLHLTLAERAEGMYGAGDEIIDLLARHYYLGNAGPKALDYLLRAGRRAKRLFANEEAILHLGRAAEIVRSEPAQADRLPDILLDVADLHDLVGGYDEALAVFSEVQDRAEDARAWSGMAAIYRKRGEYEEALGLLDRVIGDARLSRQDAARLWLERGWSEAIVGKNDDAIRSFEEGLEALGRRDEPLAGQILIQLARTEIDNERFDDALAHALEAKAVFEPGDDPRGLAAALRVLGHAYSELERFDEASASLRRGLQVAERVGSVDEIGGSLVNLGFAEYSRGDLTHAIDFTRRAVEEFERVGHEFGRALCYGNLADFLQERAGPGDLDDAEAFAGKALDLGESIGFTSTIADASFVMGRIHAKRDAWVEAARWAERAAESFVQVGQKSRAVEALELAASSFERAGEPERARPLRDRARSLGTEEA